ncbi:MAG: TAXI family TRAP transporter solute-binding subunit [Candidatus Sedimenticola endophacoides]
MCRGGTARPPLDPELISLGSLYFEPLWVFYREGQPLARLSDLADRRIAIGPEGSGTRSLALQLLEENGIRESAGQHPPLPGEAAADALVSGEVDAAFFVASPQSPVVGRLLASPGIRLLSFDRADAYTGRHRYLTSVVLPEGMIDLARNLPHKDTRLLAASANLVARKGLHPALVDLLLQAATASHGDGGWFEARGQFPSARYLAYPLSKEAQRFHEHGPPLLQRYLPFWAATLVDRLKVMLLPLVALMIPLFKLMPPLYRWRIRSRIYRWYREVLSIDRDLDSEKTDLRAAIGDLDAIDREVAKVSVPLSYAEELYDLRLHIALVREKLERSREETRPPTTA